MEIEIIKADTPTINDRIYPKEELEKAIAKIKEPLLGRLGSSITRGILQPIPRLQGLVLTIIEQTGALPTAVDWVDIRQALGSNPTNVNLLDVVFMVDNIRLEDDVVVGDMKILDTPQRPEFEELLEFVRYAPAGTGQVDDEGNISDYKFLCVDAILAAEKK